MQCAFQVDALQRVLSEGEAGVFQGYVREENLVNPIRYKHICIACAAVMSVAAPRYLLAIGRKHDEGIELRVEGDLLQTASVQIHHKNVERKTNLAFVVATK